MNTPRDTAVRPSALGVRVARDETLDSFLSRWADQQRLSLANALAGWPDVDSPRSLQTHPTDRFLTHAASVTQVPASTLRAMTTAHGWVTAKWIAASELNGVLRFPGRRAWTPTDTSPLCPSCLAETPIWPLAWRMPWVFMCVRHNSMLVEACPTCRTPLHVPSTRLPHTSKPRTRQLVTAYSHFTCQAPHTLRNTPASEDMAATQETLLTMTTRHPGKSTKRDTSWAADVRSLAALALSLATEGRTGALGPRPSVQRDLRQEARMHPTSRRRWVKKAPVHSRLRGLALQAAIVEMEGMHQHATDTPMLRALTGLDLDGAALASWIDDHTAPTPAVEHIKDQAAQQRQRTSHHLTRVQQTLDLFDFTPQSVPQLFWACSAPTGFLEAAGRPSTYMRLAFLSLCVARAATGTWIHAARALDFPADRGPQWARYVVGNVPADTRAEVAPWTTRIVGRLSTAPPAQRYQVQRHHDLMNVPQLPCARKKSSGTWCPCAQNALN